uniref:Ammonium transporter AmtB-like domain-containing protein n=1 Tax=Romanomermis culicivorax TaxID=13658 RepID=A0A915JU28_ROMCU
CRLKHKLGYDDALDVFGTHGLGGFLGNLLVGILAQKWVAALDETAIDGGWLDGHFVQLLYQLAGSTAGASWSFVWTLVIVCSMERVPFLSLRLQDLDQELGVDIAQMGETAYTEMMRKKSVDVKPLGVFTIGLRTPVKNGPPTTTLENEDFISESKRDEKMTNQAALAPMSTILETGFVLN